MNIAPNKLSTASAIFLPVQLRFSVVTAYFVKGGLHPLASGSLVRMNLFNSRFLPILYKNIFVTKLSFNLATLLSPARSSASK